MIRRLRLILGWPARYYLYGSLAWQTLAEPQTQPTAKAPAAEPVITRAHAASVSTLEGERITRVLYELELAEGERVERAYLNGLPVPIEDRDGRLALEVAPASGGLKRPPPWSS